MKSAVALALLSAAVQAHYTYPDITAAGVTATDYTGVRMTTNHYSHGPVQDVTDEQIRCYEEAGYTPPETMSVAAGDTVTFRVDPSIQHPGPLQFYMAKAPDGTTAADFAGDGDVWFKIFGDSPEVTDTGLVWPTEKLTEVSVTIPECIAPGEYLLRVEHIALHSASQAGGAQFYQACSQLSVASSGTKTFDGVAIPGVYKADDPGIMINLYNPFPTSYTNPGPDPITC
ncbi:lytic polysaccharide monooxygenase [Xylariaceae sp. FL0662B]|nr:lytic polysaccharide monooxygenase [Xylariaceae sp. FL0662B]